MGQQPNKYHISDDGKVYQIQKDGSVTEKGQIDVLLNQSTSKPNSNVKYYLKKNSIWLCVFCGVLLFLLISIFCSERLDGLGFKNGLEFFFFHSFYWIPLLTLCCVFGTWFMHKKQAKQKIWIWVVYAIGIFFMIGGRYYEYLYFDFVFLVPAITLSIWAYALQNNKNK